MVSQEEIKKESKQIMDNFMDALADIEVKQDYSLKRDVCFREESSERKEVDEDFRQRFLSNAPKTKGNAVLANKGAWVE